MKNGKICFMLLCCSFAFGLESSAAPELSVRLAQAAAAKGDDYIALRDSLAEGGPESIAPLNSLAATSDDWRVGVVAGIVLERMQKQEVIDELLRWRPGPGASRVAQERIRGIGEMLKTRAQNIPFMLVEKAWKGNTLSLLPDPDEDIACAVYALGELGQSGARRPLEMLLDHADYKVRMNAAIALGKLKMSESAGPLLAFVVAGFQAEKDISHVAATEALSVCATKEFVPVLKEELLKLESGDADDKTNRLRSLLSLLVMALDR